LDIGVLGIIVVGQATEIFWVYIPINKCVGTIITNNSGTVGFQDSTAFSMADSNSLVLLIGLTLQIGTDVRTDVTES
jgi:hypothetical protein